eukprot:CAMPEP_0194410732 /NCGR_PEP_ID=MMETSP0176-20130528/8836_1 /TAXON_ID=216777 /ORGANISM="Proboscia alata, Strain PI-D3" /LENGTH=250 /DNA_ID=CAMNT_0039212265 /DNA_START=164 /DNA_END=916 /DNA_ORIENTATION=+
MDRHKEEPKDVQNYTSHIPSENPLWILEDIATTDGSRPSKLRGSLPQPLSDGTPFDSFGLDTINHINEQQKGSSYWTGYISEELGYGGLKCTDDTIGAGAKCSGSYCDNIALKCTGYDGGIVEDRYNSGWFSEENDALYCKDGYFVAGLACKGNYCDAVELKCRKYKKIYANNDDCKWGSWYSEESPSRDEIGEGYGLVGMDCSGSYCDKKKNLYCRVNEIVNPDPVICGSVSFLCSLSFFKTLCPIECD